MSDRRPFLDFVLRLKQSEQDSDTGFLSEELLYYLHAPRFCH